MTTTLSLPQGENNMDITPTSLLTQLSEYVTIPTVAVALGVTAVAAGLYSAYKYYAGPATVPIAAAAPLLSPAIEIPELISDLKETDFAQSSNAAAPSERIELFIHVNGQQLKEVILEDDPAPVGGGVGLTAKEKLDKLKSLTNGEPELKKAIADACMPPEERAKNPAGKKFPSRADYDKAKAAYDKDQEDYNKLLNSIGEGTFIIASQGQGSEQETAIHRLVKHKATNELYFCGASKLPSRPRSKEYADADLDMQISSGLVAYRKLVTELDAAFKQLKTEQSQLEKARKELATLRAERDGLIKERVAEAAKPKPDLKKIKNIDSDIAKIDAESKKLNEEIIKLFDLVKVDYTPSGAAAPEDGDTVLYIKQRISMLQNLHKTMIIPLKEIYLIKNDGNRPTNATTPAHALFALDHPTTIFSKQIPTMPAITRAPQTAQEKSDRIIVLGNYYNTLVDFIKGPVGKLLPEHMKKALQLEVVQAINEFLDPDPEITSPEEESFKAGVKENADVILQKVKAFFAPDPENPGQTVFESTVKEIASEVISNALFTIAKGKESPHWYNYFEWGANWGDIISKHNSVPTAEWKDIKDHPIFRLLNAETIAHVKDETFGTMVDAGLQAFIASVEESKKPTKKRRAVYHISKAVDKVGSVLERACEFFNYRRGLNYRFVKAGMRNIFLNEMPRPKLKYASPRRFSVVAPYLDTSGRRGTAALGIFVPRRGGTYV